MRAVADTVNRKRWLDAEGHLLGEGIGGDVPDLRSARLARKVLPKESSHLAVRALDVLVCGGSWFPRRRCPCVLLLRRTGNGLPPLLGMPAVARRRGRHGHLAPGPDRLRERPLSGQVLVARAALPAGMAPTPTFPAFGSARLLRTLGMFDSLRRGGTVYPDGSGGDLTRLTATALGPAAEPPFSDTPTTTASTSQRWMS